MERTGAPGLSALKNSLGVPLSRLSTTARTAASANATTIAATTTTIVRRRLPALRIGGRAWFSAESGMQLLEIVGQGAVEPAACAGQGVIEGQAPSMKER